MFPNFAMHAMHVRSTRGVSRVRLGEGGWACHNFGWDSGVKVNLVTCIVIESYTLGFLVRF